MTKLSPHFHSHEFTCRCCGELHPDGVPTALLDVLEDVRAHFGQPVFVNSGYRCERHNAAVGGVPNSQHLLGTAADIDVKNVAPIEVFMYLDPAHDGGLGKYSTFTHVDVRDGRARW